MPKAILAAKAHARSRATRTPLRKLLVVSRSLTARVKAHHHRAICKQPERGGDDGPFAKLVKHNGLQRCLPCFVRRQVWIFGDDLGIGVGESEHRLKKREG
jgi:hypothetical protein